MKEQLTLNDLCGYLPFDLNIFWNDGETIEMDIYNIHKVIDIAGKYIGENRWKPIFRNLATDLTDEMIGELEGYHNFSTMRFSDIKTDPTRYPYTICQKLMEWHFWLGDQSYFEKKIILDYNDVNGL